MRDCPHQRKRTEPARSDSFSYNGRNELTTATLGAAPYGYSYGQHRQPQDGAGTGRGTRLRGQRTPTSTPARRLGQPDPHQDVNGHLDGGVQRGQPRDEFHQPRRRDSRGMRLRLPGTKVHEEGDGNGTVASHERYLYTAIC